MKVDFKTTRHCQLSEKLGCCFAWCWGEVTRREWSNRVLLWPEDLLFLDNSISAARILFRMNASTEKYCSDTLILYSSIFWYITSCSLLKVNRRFGVTCRPRLQDLRIIQARNWSGTRPYLPPAFEPVSCSSNSSIMKMRAIFFFKTSVYFQQDKWCYILEDRTLHKPLSEPQILQCS
jgi:hypothetical protein